MAKLSFVLGTTLFVTLVATVPVQAARVSYGDIVITVENEPRGQTSHGYTEYRVQIVNKGSDRSRTVSVMFPGNTITGRGLDGGIKSISRTVQVDPGKMTTISLFQPAMPDILGNAMSVTIDGRKQDDMIAMTPASGVGGGYRSSRRSRYYGMMSHSSGAVQSLILTSQRVDENFLKVPGLRAGALPGGGVGFPGAMGPGPEVPPPARVPPGGPAGEGVALDPDPPPGGAAPPPVPPPAMGAAGGPGMAGAPMGRVGFVVHQAIDGFILRADSPVSTWSSHWLAYTRYDGIFVTREDLEELERGTADTKAILQALWQYVETGGSLIVLGPGQVSLPATWNRQASGANGLKLSRVGFGICIVAPDRKSDKWPVERWETIQNAVNGTSMPWRSSRGLVELNQAFAVVDDLAIPVRGLFAILLLFGIAIGPVNLVVLSRMNRRIWLLWTVPVLSAFFCLLVLGYMIVAEGWTGHARVSGFTLLDENERRATTIGKTAFYSPMTPADGLRFSQETEVQLQGGEHPALTNYCSIDWTDDQHLSRGWVTARVPAHFTLRKSESRRERLTIRKESDGSMVVINALGADMSKLLLADEKGNLYKTGPIVAGESARLEHAGKLERTDRPMESLRQKYAGIDWGMLITEARQKPEDYLGPNMYLAVLDESPFLEQGFRKARVRPSSSIVLGLMAK
jgi:hypothetical protein